MKIRIILTILLFGLQSLASIQIDQKFLDAMIQVESNGDSTKVGKHGEVGVLQIRQCVITDVNRICKTHYTLSDAKDEEKAVKICKLYLIHYGNYYEKRTGKKADNKILSMIWNGGPLAPWKKKVEVVTNLNKYWAKILLAMV